MPLVEHLEPALGGGVGRDGRPAELAVDRADVDDRSLLARDHATRHDLSDDERAVQVRAHHLAPSVVREFLERHAPLNAGIVDENVDRTGLALDALNRGFNAGAIGDVERGLMHGGTDAFERLRSGSEPVHVATVEDNAGARTGKSLGECIADAGG